MCAEKLRHIDAAIYNTDCLFFAELKKTYLSEKWALAKWFSIWRYHHCNFDLVCGPHVPTFLNLVLTLGSSNDRGAI